LPKHPAPISIPIILFVLAKAAAQMATVPPAQIHAGPVYTRSADVTGPGEAYPQYPYLQIRIELPPGTTPDQVAPEAFRLAVDGRSAAYATRVQTLASTGYGVTASLSLDVSGSMKGAPLNAVRSGLKKFVDDAGANDRVAIQTIADDGRWNVDWDDPHDKVRDALDQLATRGKLTRLWDQLLVALDRFPSTPLARRLIVISDGHDEGSVHKEEEVIAAARNRGIPVDAIGVTRSSPEYLKTLQRLAAETGGQFRVAKDTNELQQLVGSGITRLKSAPVVSFRVARAPADGGRHQLEVTWTHDGTESTAEVAAMVPLISTFSRTRWIWVGGVGMAALALIAVALGAMRGKRSLQTSHVSAPPPLSAPANTSPPVEQNPPRSTPPAEPIPSVKTSVAERAKTGVGACYPAPAASGPTAWLFCESGFAPGTRFPIDQAEYWIGAADGNQLQIVDDPTVSRRHARVVLDQGVLGIHDHHSTNGTAVNGVRIQDTRQLLYPGDRIRIGQSILIVQAADQVDPTA
jgi:hypothetical protein